MYSLCRTQMSHCHGNNLIFSSLTLHPPNHRPSLSPPLTSFPSKPTGFYSVSAHPRPRPVPWLVQVTDPITSIVSEDGPVELPSSVSSIFSTTDDPTPLQVGASVLLTGAISVFLFRSLRRRANRAKELKFRSTGASKSLKDEALDSLKAMQTASIEPDKPPSPVQAFLGGIAAGAIALVLYKFAVTVEGGLNRQTISDNYSVRQITITIRTIINGLCYLATFVFGINGVGLVLYSIQLAFNSFMGDSSSEETENEDGRVLTSSANATDSSSDSTNSQSDDSKDTQSSNDI